MIELKNLTKIYKTKRKSSVRAIDDISLKFPDKGFVFVIGKSGSGKSTLLNMIGGLDSATNGEIIVNGKDVTKLNAAEATKYRNSNIGFVFQDYHVIDHLTVYENVSLSLELANNNNNYEKVNEIIKKVELEEYSERFPKELSGGQKQRVAIARAIIKDVDIFLCDEPTGNLDKKTTTQVLKILKEISKEKLVIIVSHNMLDAERYADRIIELAEGKVIRDREYAENYNNDFIIADNTVMLPHYRDLETEEVERINEKIRNGEKLNFKQIKNKFVETKDVNSNLEKKLLLTKSSVSRRTIKKLYKSFFTNRLSTLFSVFLAAVLLTCFAVFQSFLGFDGNGALQSSLLKNNIDTLPLQKGIVDESNSTLSNVLFVNDEDISSFKDNGYKDKIYYKYNYTLPITSITIDKEVSMLYSTIFKQFYMTESLGIIECDNDYLNRLFGVNGEVRFLALADEEKDYGIYITDYMADSINFYKKEKMTYEEMLGQYKYSTHVFGYINGIIDTDYDEKYKEISASIEESIKNPNGVNNYKEIVKTDLYKEFLTEATYSLAYGYTLANDFIETIKNSENRPWIRLSRYKVSMGEEDVKFVKANECFSLFDSKELYPDLKGNNVILSVNNYKTLFGITYTNIDEFVPHSMTLTFYENNSDDGKILYQKELFIVGLNKTNNSYINVDDNGDLRELDIIRYGVILENHNMIEIMSNVASERKMTISLMDSQQTYYVNKIIKTFNQMFRLIELFFLTITIIFLVFIGISTIKQNKYEIGVLKAIGVGTFSLMKIFIKQSIKLVIYIAIVSNIGIFVGTFLANKVMINAIEEILGVVVSDITIIRYIPSLVIQDLFNIAIIAIISFIIPQVLLYKIRPIEIIRARE